MTAGARSHGGVPETPEQSAPIAARMNEMPATRWSVVLRAGNRNLPDWSAALEEIARAYRPVFLRHLVVHFGFSPDRAEDWVQAFLAEKLLVRNLLDEARQERGRLRSFLLKAFYNDMTSRLRSEQAAKRRPLGIDALPLDHVPEPISAESTPPENLDALWARQVVAQTIDRMRETCHASGRQALWGVFEARVLAPLFDNARAIPYQDLIVQFDLPSPSEASNLLITAKRMFARMMREVVSETVADGRDVEDEIRELKHILSKS